MKSITVPALKDDSLSSQLLALHESLKNNTKQESIDFDLSKISWMCPLLALPLAVYISDSSSTFSAHNNEKLISYMKAISFPEGVNSVLSFEQQFNSLKNFVPISCLDKARGEDKDKLQTQFLEMVYRFVDVSKSGIRDAVYQPISESIDNVFEHSKKDQCYVFGQYYPTKEHLDICIVDSGRGIAGAYKEEKELSYNDEEALQQAMQGLSTKHDSGRGTGIRTSKSIVCKELGGRFVMISGNAALLASRQTERVVALPNFNWKGVIIAYRMPKPQNSVNIYSHIKI